MSVDEDRPRKRRRVHASTDLREARESLQAFVQERDKHKRFNVVILSGAGLDQPSGVPTYNGLGAAPTKNGRSHDLFEYTSGSDLRQPWTKAFRLRRRVSEVKDVHNTAKDIINKLMTAGGRRQLGWPDFVDMTVTHITQNISGLARLALTGSLEMPHPNLIELHGRVSEDKCPVCKFEKIGDILPKEVDLNDHALLCDQKYIPRCPKCLKGKHKRDTMMLPAIVNEKTRINNPPCLDDCDLMLVVGTRGRVDPAGMFPEYVQKYQKSGKKALVFYFNYGNPARKGQYTYFIDGSCSDTMPVVLDFRTDMPAAIPQPKKEDNIKGEQTNAVLNVLPWAPLIDYP